MNNLKNDEEALLETSASDSVHVYKFRWFILALYSLTAFANTLVWLSLFTISDATCAFYKIDAYKLLWSSNAFTFMQVVIAIPASFIPSKLGLRTTMILAGTINAVGACIMIAATYRDGFLFFVFGQTIIAIAASILPQLAPEVSAVWFPKNEHAISTSIGIILGNAGAAIGFLQPALLIKDVDIEKDISVVGEKLKELIYSQAVLCIILLLCVIFVFKNKPKKPPSMSQAIRSGPELFTFSEFKSNYFQLFRNCNYLLCANAYALSSVLLIVVPVLLNQLMSWKYQHQDDIVGWMGFSGIIVGIFGSILFGFIIDRTQAYKKLSLVLAAVSVLSWISFTEALAQWNSIVLNFFLFVFCLFVFIPFGPILVDMISEMTYPIPESSSFVIPITVGRFYSIPIVFLLGWLVEEKRYHLSCYVIASVIGLCFILVALAKVTPRRTLAEKNNDLVYE